MKRLIVFVCRGNIHRSVLAQIVLEESSAVRKRYNIISRGIQGMPNFPPPQFSNLSQYTEEWNITRPILEKISVPIDSFAAHQAKALDEAIMQEAYLVIAMDIKVHNILQEIFPEYNTKTVLFSTFIGESQDIDDCAESSNHEKHERVNRFIVDGVREKLIHKLL